MDRDDARLVVRALRARIDRDGDTLDAIARSEMVRLAMAAGRIKALSENWPPALIAVGELENIGKHGRFALDDGEPSALLGRFIVKLEELIADDPETLHLARNRAERRASAARGRRIHVGRAPRIIGINKPALVTATDPIDQ